MAGVIKGKLRASTLVEVLVSMVIILGVFAIAMGIYIKITGSGFSLTQKQVQQQMQSIIQQSREEADFTDAVVKLDDTEYHKRVSRYGQYHDLYNVQVEAIQNGVKVGSLKQVIRKDED